MSASNDAAGWVPLFPEEETPHILLTVLRCSKLLRKRNDNEHENALTDRLYKLLRQDAIYRSRPIFVDREASLYDLAGSNETPIGRVDLRFIFSTGTRKPWPYFAIECKRLHVSFPSGWKSLVSEYVTGDQGMLCFLERRYADGLRAGGMLGYVFDGDVDSARARVAVEIEANGQALKPNTQPCRMVPSNIVPGERGIGETTHKLPHVFTIYHLFVSV